MTAARMRRAQRDALKIGGGIAKVDGKNEQADREGREDD